MSCAAASWYVLNKSLQSCLPGSTPIWPRTSQFCKAPLETSFEKKKQKTSSGDHSTILCYSLKVGHVFLKRGKWSLITFFFPFFPDVRSRKRHLHSILWLLVSLGPSGHLDSTLTPTPPHCSTSWMNGLSTCLVHFLLGSLSSECINLNLFKPLKLSVLFKHSIVLCEFF